MSSSWIGPALALAIAAAPFATPADAPGRAGAEAAAEDGALAGQDLDHPPPGSPADAALWRAGHEVTQAIHIERARATRLQAVLVSLRYGERIQALGERGGEARERAVALRRRLGDAHGVQHAILTARWPVDTYRVCGYPAMEFGSMLAYGRSGPADLAKHRAMLVGCVEQAEASLGAMREGNDGLEEAMKAADARLAAEGLGAGGGALARPAPSPERAPARTAAAGREEEHGEAGRHRHERGGDR